MDHLPDKVQEFIIDNKQFYGKHFWTFAHLNHEELQPFLNNGTHPLYCVYMPVVDHRPQFENTGFVAIPSFWQGIPGQYEIYLEPASDELIQSIELISCFEAVLSDRSKTNELYQQSHVKIIKQRLTQFKRDNQVHVEKGYLVKLNPQKVPYAAKYPIARVVSVLTHAKGGFDCKIIHQKIANSKIISIPHSGGWIYKSAIECVLSTSTDRNVHFGIYNQQISTKTLIRKKELKRQVKKDKEDELNDIMIGYVGTKVNNCLNEQNFKKSNKSKKKACTVEETIRSKNINDNLIPKLKKNNFSFKNNKTYLKIVVKNPKEMGKLIGRQNLIKRKNGFEYFLHYPIEMVYGYKWVFPRLKLEFDVCKINRAGNFEL